MMYLRTDCFVVPAKFASVRGSKCDIKFYFKTRKRQLLEFFEHLYIFIIIIFFLDRRGYKLHCLDFVTNKKSI